MSELMQLVLGLLIGYFLSVFIRVFAFELEQKEKKEMLKKEKEMEEEMEPKRKRIKEERLIKFVKFFCDKEARELFWLLRTNKNYYDNGDIRKHHDIPYNYISSHEKVEDDDGKEWFKTELRGDEDWAKRYCKHYGFSFKENKEFIKKTEVFND